MADAFVCPVPSLDLLWLAIIFDSVTICRCDSAKEELLETVPELAEGAIQWAVSTTSSSSSVPVSCCTSLSRLST